MTSTYDEEPLLNIFENTGYTSLQNVYTVNADTPTVTAKDGGNGLYGGYGSGNISSAQLWNGTGIAQYTLYYSPELTGASRTFTATSDLLGDNTNSLSLSLINPNQVRFDCCTSAKSGPLCGTLYSDTGSTLCKGLVANACALDVSSAYCQNYALSNPGTCDVAAAAYCKKNPTASFCNCINSKVVAMPGSNAPNCLDAQCLKSGYVTSAMKNTKCPDIVNCTVQAQILSSGVTLNAGIPVTQNCGNNTTTTTTTPVTVVPPAQIPASTVGTISSTYYIYLFIIFIVAIFLGIGLFTSGKSLFTKLHGPAAQ